MVVADAFAISPPKKYLKCFATTNDENMQPELLDEIIFDDEPKTKKEKYRRVRAFLRDLKPVMERHKVQHVDIASCEFGSIKFRKKQ